MEPRDWLVMGLVLALVAGLVSFVVGWMVHGSPWIHIDLTTWK